MVTYVVDLKNLMKITGRFLRTNDVPEHFSKTKNEVYSLHQMLVLFVLYCILDMPIDRFGEIIKLMSALSEARFVEAKFSHASGFSESCYDAPVPGSAPRPPPPPPNRKGIVIATRNWRNDGGVTHQSYVRLLYETGAEPDQHKEIRLLVTFPGEDLRPLIREITVTGPIAEMDRFLKNNDASVQKLDLDPREYVAGDCHSFYVYELKRSRDAE